MGHQVPHLRQKKTALFTRLGQVATELAAPRDAPFSVDALFQHARDLSAADAVALLRLYSNDVVDTVAVSAPSVARASEVQLQHHQGPCLEALCTGRTTVVDDTRTDERWPTWGRDVAELNWRSVLGVPLSAPHGRWGVLNLYSRHPYAFGADDVAALDIFGGLASMALIKTQEGDAVRDAFRARQLVAQAQGILMGRLGLGQDQAFSRLRQAARDHGCSIADAARQLVATGELSPPARDRLPVGPPSRTPTLQTPLSCSPG